MIGIGPFEIFAVLLVLLIVVGPERMPEIVRFLTRIMREVRSAASEMRDQVEHMAEIDEIRKDTAEMRQSVEQAVVPDDLRLIDPPAPSAAAADSAAGDDSVLPVDPPAPSGASEETGIQEPAKHE